MFSKAPRLSFVIITCLTLLLVGSVWALYPVIERYVSDVLVDKSRRTFAAGQLGAAWNYADKALALRERKDAYVQKTVIATAQLNQLLATQTSSADKIRQEFQETLTRGVEAGLKALSLSPHSTEQLLNMAVLYSILVPLQVEGAYEKAKDAYLRAMVLDPRNPEIPFQLAQLEIAQGNSTTAEEYLGRAIFLKKNYTPAIILLSQLQVSAGRIQDALAAAEAAMYFQPNDSSTLFQVGILRAVSGDTRGAMQALSAAVTSDAQFVNARYYLAALYATHGDLASSLYEIEAIAAVSAENAKAVEWIRKELAAGKNPFPENLLSAPAEPLAR